MTNEQGGKIIGNRTRPFAYTFRATDKERQIIDEKIKQSGLTMTEFVIRAIKDKPFTVIENAGELLVELKRQGNNLNQAVRNNYYGIETEGYLNKKQRTEQYEINGTVYTVTVEENENANTTALDIIKRLVSQRNDRLIRTTERTCCLPTNGGKKVC